MRAEREFSLNTVAWKRLRARVLAESPLCVHCADRGIVRAAQHVDHINGDAMDNRPENLQGLCVSCHSRKTAREVNARVRERGGRVELVY
jgi:5-methylcytosine-specific restriction endonuclease McrA